MLTISWSRKKAPDVRLQGFLGRVAVELHASLRVSDLDQVPIHGAVEPSVVFNPTKRLGPQPVEFQPEGLDGAQEH